MNKELAKLVAEYYDLIGGDHHKDKDCHFYITLDYRYDGQLEITVSHYGYIRELVSTCVDSLGAGEQILIDFLTEAIKEERANLNDE